MKIYVALVEVLKKKERGDETQFTTQMIMEPYPNSIKRKHPRKGEKKKLGARTQNHNFEST
jgi:hypothetical protein